jgi:FixJ family two-component response regulator
MTAAPLVLISVVDDDLSVRRALRRLLASAGFAVETFASGFEFLESEPQTRTSCVVLDVHLGEPSGFDVYERLVATGIPVPTIFITAFDDEDTRNRARRTEAIAYLRKPFDERALLDAIAQAIRRNDNPQPKSKTRSSEWDGWTW